MNFLRGILLILALSAIIVTSSDVSIKDDPCSKFDSCYSKPILRTCSCDNDCHIYGTCCHDLNKFRRNISTSDFQCYHRHTITPVYVKRSCSDDFSGHPGDRKACFEDDVDQKDVVNNLLVTSRRTKVTYWNSHCAVCSNEIEKDLEFWNIEVFCPFQNGIDRNFIRKNLLFDEDAKRWGLNVSGEFLKCVVKYTPPPYIDEVKHCTPNLISSCLPEYSDENVVGKCSKYYGERKRKNSDEYYRNIYCALCNGVGLTELECPGMWTPEETAEETDFRNMVEEVFTRGERLQKETKIKEKCSKEYVYDPFWAKCRRDDIKGYGSHAEDSSVLHRLNIVLLIGGVTAVHFLTVNKKLF